MKIQIRLSMDADEAAKRYQTLTEAWRSLYNAAMDRQNSGFPAAIESLRSQAYDIASSFLETERELIAARAEEIVREALTATQRDLSLDDALDVSDEVGELLNESQRYLAQEIAIQIERDIAHLIRSYQKVALQIRLSAQSRAISVRTAAIEHRMGNLGELQFYFHDRLSRKWSSNKFIRAVWRMTMLSIYNETVLLTLSDYGRQLAYIEHLDVKSPAHGVVLSMSSTSSYPTYTEIRDEYFHPNSDAIIVGAGEATDVST
jgi:hypothetical protein